MVEIEIGGEGEREVELEGDVDEVGDGDGRRRRERRRRRGFERNDRLKHDHYYATLALVGHLSACVCLVTRSLKWAHGGWREENKE